MPIRVYYATKPGYREWQLDEARYAPEGVAVVAPKPENTPEPQAKPKEDKVKSAFLSLRNNALKFNFLLVNKRELGHPDADAAYLYSGVVEKPEIPYVSEVENPYVLAYFGALALKNPIVKRKLISAMKSENLLKMLCLSKACKTSMIRIFGEEISGKVDYLYPAVPPIPKKSGDSDFPRFIFSSYSALLKGGREIVRASKKLEGKYKITMVTRMPDELKTECAKQNIEALGFNLKRAQFLEMLPNYDVVLHPTYMDCFGLAPFEGVNAGLAGICTNVYALPEFIQHEKNGFTFDSPVDYFDKKTLDANLRFWLLETAEDYVRKRSFPEVENKLAEHMQYYIDNPSELKNHKRNSLKLAEEELSLEVRNRKLLKIFQEGTKPKQ